MTTTSLAESDRDSILSGLDHLRDQAVEGIVVIAPQVRIFEVVKELALTVPVVTLDSTGRDASRSLSIDQMTGARLATRHLIDLGHQEIVHVAGPQDWIEAEARMEGFLREVDDADLRTHPPFLGDWTADFGHHVGRELLRFRDFTAVFAANDQMALGLLHAFRSAGLDVPGDISVVGFDDVPEARHYWPPLTTVRQDFVEVGRRTVAHLIAQLEGRLDLPGEQIRPELIVRDSTAPPARL